MLFQRSRVSSCCLLLWRHVPVFWSPAWLSRPSRYLIVPAFLLLCSHPPPYRLTACSVGSDRFANSCTGSYKALLGSPRSIMPHRIWTSSAAGVYVCMLDRHETTRLLFGNLIFFSNHAQFIANDHLTPIWFTRPTCQFSYRSKLCCYKCLHTAFRCYKCYYAAHRPFQ